MATSAVTRLWSLRTSQAAPECRRFAAPAYRSCGFVCRYACLAFKDQTGRCASHTAALSAATRFHCDMAIVEALRRVVASLATAGFPSR